MVSELVFIDPLVNDRGGPIQRAVKNKCIWCKGIRMSIPVAAQVLYVTQQKLEKAINKYGEKEAVLMLSSRD